MSSYILVETSGETKSRAFASLQDLHKWTSDELGLSEMSLSEATKKEIQRIESEFREVEELIEETSKKYYIPIDSTDEKLIEHRKEFELFNEHPKYLYYYVKTYVLLGHIAKKGRKIHEYFEKAYNFKLPEGQIFKPSEYHDAVKVLYKVFGKVLPQLAYVLRLSYFDETGKLYVYGNDLELPDMKEPEKQWVQEFMNTFYEPAKGSAVKRTDFVAHFNEHIEEVMNSFPEDDMVARKYYLNFGFPFASNPEKVLDLPMVRRSAGMYISDIQRRAIKPVPEISDPKKELLLTYHSPMNTLFEELAPLNKPSMGELRGDQCHPVYIDKNIVNSSMYYPLDKKFTLSLNNHPLPFVLSESNVFSSFRVTNGNEMINRMTLFINDKQIDRIYPSKQVNGGSFNLLEGENFIPTKYKVDILIEFHTEYPPNSNNFKCEYDDFKCEYILRKTKDTELKDRTFWFTKTVFSHIPINNNTSLTYELRIPYERMIDKLDMLLPPDAKTPELYFNGHKVQLRKVYYKNEDKQAHKRWIMDLKEYFGENTINFSYVNEIIIKYELSCIPSKILDPLVFGTQRTIIRFYDDGKFELPFDIAPDDEDRINKHVLIIGSGKVFGAGGIECSHLLGNSSLSTYNNRCLPQGFRQSHFMCSNFTFIDINPEVKPDIVADVTKDGWWKGIDLNFDRIVDTIGHLGPHIQDNKYIDAFKMGCRALLKPGGIISGHAVL